MQTMKQRNPYLKRTYSETPHKYFYDIVTGKYLLITQDGKQQIINKTGSLKVKFRKYFTGFVNHKQRYQQGKLDPSILHFVPDLKCNENNSYHYPMPDKFAGYAQYPYKIGDFPSHLKPHTAKPKYKIKKCNSQSCNKAQRIIDKNHSIQRHFSLNQQSDDKFFDKSFMNITVSKPLPRQKKKTCYNYKCKYLKNFTFNTKTKEYEKTNCTNGINRTFGKSFYDKNFDNETKETSMAFNN